MQMPSCCVPIKEGEGCKLKDVCEVYQFLLKDPGTSFDSFFSQVIERRPTECPLFTSDAGDDSLYNWITQLLQEQIDQKKEQEEFYLARKMEVAANLCGHDATILKNLLNKIITFKNK